MPDVQTSATPPAEASPTPPVEASATPQAEPSPTLPVEASATPPAEASPRLPVEASATPQGNQAPQQYWRAAGVESEPVLRANALVAKARVSLSHGEIPAAADDLEQALAAAPQHPAALVLLAEISYRKQEWHRARELYTALERAPDVAEVVPREQIVQRRAALANRLGDTAEAEALYRELAILSPRHAEARRVLAELALARGDTATAALRLEELLRLLPAGSSAELGELRHRLGAIYAETGEWNGARYYLELVVDQDPEPPARPGAAAPDLPEAGAASRGRGGLRPAGASLPRSRASRRRSLPPGGDPAQRAGRRAGRARRLPPLL